MGPTILFTHLKIILLQCFQFSVFSNNKLNPNGSIVSYLHLLKERIFFFMCILNLIFFKLGLCVFNYSPVLNFPQNCFSKNLFCFSYFYGGKRVFFFNFCCSQSELLLFIGGVASILYRAGFICFLDSLFSLDFCCVCFLFTPCWSCQQVTKMGRFR